jgi:flagellar P-ring protein precursor FlgI
VTETPVVSQPGAFSAGQTVVAPRTNVEVEDQSNRRLALIQGGVTLQDLVSSLNALGVGPREIMTILQTIKAAGALQAELELR